MPSIAFSDRSSSTITFFRENKSNRNVLIPSSNSSMQNLEYFFARTSLLVDLIYLVLTGLFSLTRQMTPGTTFTVSAGLLEQEMSARACYFYLKVKLGSCGT
jgi:hypothetical protein